MKLSTDRRAPQPKPRKPKKAPRLGAVRLEPRITPGTSMQHNETLVREPTEAEKPAPSAREDADKTRLRVVRLEDRIAPRSGGGGCDDFGCGTNHNETLVRVPGKAKPRKVGRLKVVKLEPRLAPGIWQNHNETLIRDRA
jgi:hypothetical protein